MCDCFLTHCWQPSFPPCQHPAEEQGSTCRVADRKGSTAALHVLSLQTGSGRVGTLTEVGGGGSRAASDGNSDVQPRIKCSLMLRDMFTCYVSDSLFHELINDVMVSSHLTDG